MRIRLSGGLSTTIPVAVKLAIIQQKANPNDTDALAHATALVRRAAEQGGQVIVLPELFRWPYPAQEMDPSGFDRAEPSDGPTVTAMCTLAAELGVVLVASYFEERAPGLGFNSAAVIGPDGSVLAHYRKAHIPDDPLYYEKFYFTPGDTPFQAVDTPFGCIGVLVCWDQWFPEAARLTAMSGADVIVYPTAIGTMESEPVDEHARQRDAWVTVQRGHAVANGVYVAGVNRVGREGELDFWGTSFVAGPQGEMLCELHEEADAIAIVDVERERVHEVRRMWPFFRDRRIDLYAPLLNRWGR